MVWIALIVVGNLISLIIGKSCVPDYNFLHKPSEVFNSFVKQLHAYSGLIANDRIVKVYERGILKSLAGIRKNINPAAPHRLQWHPCMGIHLFFRYPHHDTVLETSPHLFAF